FTEDTKKAISIDVNYENWYKCLERIFLYIKDNKTFFENVCKSNGHEIFERKLYDAMRYYLGIVIEELDVDKKLKDQEKTFVEDFFAYAIVGIILAWIKNGMKEDHTIIVERIQKLVAGDALKFIG
ncbi:MAG: TetR-like C-terminal domain-containing protein, partial [Anaerovoracaceae bacterium]